MIRDETCVIFILLYLKFDKKIPIKIRITNVEINGDETGLDENFWMTGELPSEATSVPVCNEVIFNGDGSVFSASCK